MSRDDAVRVRRFRLKAGRMEAFSDGVFAIAITLLVLEIAVPMVGDSQLLRAILEEWPSYLAYLVSFATIGAIWIGHVTMTEFLAEVSPGFLRLNLVLLLFVGLLPFPTRLLAENLTSEENERVAVTLYGVVLGVIALLLSALWRYALRDGLIGSDRKSGDVRLLTRRLTPSLGFYVIVIIVGVFFPTVAVFGYLLIAIGLLIPTRRTG